MRGLVRLQAFVRSRRVMRQANTTMRTVQAITRVQGRLRTHQARMSEDGLAVQHQVWQKSQPIIRKESVSVFHCFIEKCFTVQTYMHATSLNLKLLRAVEKHRMFIVSAVVDFLPGASYNPFSNNHQCFSILRNG